MSGTSADGIDACLAEIDAQNIRALSHQFQPYPSSLKAKIEQLFTPTNNEIDHLGELNIELAEHYARAVKALLEKSGKNASDIQAIGNHGQTVRHRPNAKRPFTLQVGCATRLAMLTQIPVISDFRTADMALGGQGAPLVPAFHQAIFGSHEQNCAVVNVGGIANITLLNKNGNVRGWDTGPGNGLMDAWIQQQKQQPYDHDGEWAASGQVNQVALETLLKHPYFQRSAPKSTGKEEFTLDWVLANALPMPPEDLQATLLMLTCKSIALALSDTHIENLYLCGGGALNGQLMATLDALITAPVQTTQTLGVDPMHVEALAFAWLAYRFEHNLPGNLPCVTGATREAILGTKHQPQ